MVRDAPVPSSAWMAVPLDEYMPTFDTLREAETVGLPVMLMRDFLNATGAPVNG